MESSEIDKTAELIEFTTREQNRDLACDIALQAH